MEDQYVKFRLDPRLIEELNIEAVGLGEHLKRENIQIENDKIIIRDIDIQHLTESSLRLIYDLNTGKKKWKDCDPEMFFIKIDETWYRTLLISTGVKIMNNNRSEYISEFMILK